MDQAAVQQLIAAALHEQSQQVQAELVALQDRLARRSRPRPTLPDTDKFDGSFDHWEIWYPEIKAKLQIDGEALGGTNKAKFWYVIGRLEKKPKSSVAPQITAAERDQSYSPQSLFDQLLRLCNNPNAKKEAERHFVSIKQYPDQAFNTFLTAFEKFMYRSGADAWHDAARIALLRKALTDKLKRKLAAKDEDDIPDDNYNDFVTTVQALESGYDGDKPSGTYVPGQKKLWEPKEKADPDAMQIGAITRYVPGTEISDDDSELD